MFPLPGLILPSLGKVAFELSSPLIFRGMPLFNLRQALGACVGALLVKAQALAFGWSKLDGLAARVSWKPLGLEASRSLRL